MSEFFLILIGFFIVLANVFGFIFYRKKKNLYFVAFTILVFAVLFGAIGGLIALFVIRDAFAIFFGLQVGSYLLVNSIFVFIIAILLTVIKKVIHHYVQPMGKR